jgi:hypothetical protein
MAVRVTCFPAVMHDSRLGLSINREMKRKDSLKIDENDTIKNHI